MNKLQASFCVRILSLVILNSVLMTGTAAAADKVNPGILRLCSGFIVDKNPADVFQTSGGSLSKTMRATARELVPVNYTLQSLGFQVPQSEPIVVHATQVFSQFYNSGTQAQLALDPNALTSYTGKTPEILLVGEHRDLDWYFDRLGKYNFETSTLLADLKAAEEGSASWVPEPAPITVDHILAPEVWQTMTREQRRQLVATSFKRLQWGGTLRITIRVKNVDLVAPELNGFLDANGGIQQLWTSLQSQVAAALPGETYKMMLRVQKVSYEPAEAQLTSEEFFDGLGPTLNLNMGRNFSPFGTIQQPSLQALLVVRKPGSFWGDTFKY